MKIAIIFGTRPEAIKLAPVIYSLQNYFELNVISSGQHVELLESILNFFRIKPHYNFHCMNKKPDLGTLTARINMDIAKVLKQEKINAIIVQGDTMTTYSGAFQGFLNQIPVFHVEAGLRTKNKFSPFPEEMLRTITSRLADFHFAPTVSARDNLINEKVRPDRILITGNTVVDALLMAEKLINEKEIYRELDNYSTGISRLLEKKKVVLVTSHRRENIRFGLKQICKAVNILSRKYQDILFIWPLHKNPDVRKVVFNEIDRHSVNIILTEPLSYQTTVYLMRQAFIIMTDSGGIQEEAPTFKKPILILRESTERPEVIEAGVGFLTGPDTHKIIDTFQQLYHDRKFYLKVAKKQNPFGDGKASNRILKFFQRKDIQNFIEHYPEFYNQIFKPFRQGGNYEK
jgi:UDP-N-acetylglucosamine 2-epimerase